MTTIIWQKPHPANPFAVGDIVCYTANLLQLYTVTGFVGVLCMLMPRPYNGMPAEAAFADALMLIKGIGVEDGPPAELTWAEKMASRRRRA